MDTGESLPFFSSIDTNRGKELEPEARQTYTQYTGNEVVEASFITHNSFQFIGVSPDGLVDFDGLIEVKCPRPLKHLKISLTGMPDEYWAQVQGNMWVLGREWCDFISYSPWYTKQPLYVQRIFRDEDYIGDLARGCVHFWEAVSTRNIEHWYLKVRYEQNNSDRQTSERPGREVQPKRRGRRKRDGSDG